MGRNPFVPSPSSSPGPSVAGSQPTLLVDTKDSQPPSLAGVPAITLSSPPVLNTTKSPPQTNFDLIDLEEPPPYSLNAPVTSGEATVEVGPSRPFQTAQPSANPSRNERSHVQNQAIHNRIPSSSSSPLPSSSPLTPPERTASVARQLTNSLTNVVNNLNSAASSHLNTSNYNQGAASVQPTGQSNTWTSYPGQTARTSVPPPSNQTPRSAPPVLPPRQPSSAPLQPPSNSAPRNAPPSLPPRQTSLQRPPISTSTHSMPSMANHTSDFARDFYAASGGSTENSFAPPPGPPSESQTSSTHGAIPNDGRPTSQPEPGHPLLKDGNLLVYPKGHECRKCHNVGYKDANPQKPCKQCWKKFAKPFTGPLAYSFAANASSSTVASNFQKPLPRPIRPPASPPAPAASAFSSPPPRALSAPGGYMTSHHGRFQNPPTFIPSIPPPTSSSVTYMAGDPRIGGRLCFRCGGAGNLSLMLFISETCPLCAGVGRLFQ